MTERDERLAARLGTPLPSERAAADRNWRALTSAIAVPPRRRFGRLLSVATSVAVVAIVIAALGWWQGARVDVAGDRLPVLYREEVTSTAIAAPGIEASIVIAQKHIESDARLRVVAVTDVRLAADRLPATTELRFQRPEDDSYGVLGRSQLSEPPRATGTTRTVYDAPFPPMEARDRVTYRVWLHIETATGPIDSAVLVITVTDQPEGQRARAGGTL